jgi:3-oxoadipate enol-lactonase
MSKFSINDVELYYEVAGDPQAKETVVFLNGVMASTSSWVNQVEAFKKRGYRILLHDFKGQLNSDKPQGPYTFHQHAFETVELMQSLGIEKAHIVGASYGGVVGLRMAIDFPIFVQSLTVIDAVSELDPLLEGFVVAWRRLCDDLDGEAFFIGTMPTLYGRTYIEKNRATLLRQARLMKRFPEEYFIGQTYLYDTFLSDIAMSDELHKITCPVLIVNGEEDILCPARFSRIMQRNTKNSLWVEIPDCGHAAIVEQPEALNSIVIGFLAKL